MSSSSSPLRGWQPGLARTYVRFVVRFRDSTLKLGQMRKIDTQMHEFHSLSCIGGYVLLFFMCVSFQGTGALHYSGQIPCIPQGRLTPCTFWRSVPNSEIRRYWDDPYLYSGAAKTYVDISPLFIVHVMVAQYDRRKPSGRLLINHIFFPFFLTGQHFIWQICTLYLPQNEKKPFFLP